MDLVGLARAASERALSRREDRLGANVAPEEIRSRLRERYDLARPVPVPDLLGDVEDMLTRWTEHATNPRHFGLFRPAPDPLCVVADALVALHDPNLATWDFAPAANEIERFVLGAFAERFGLPADEGLHHFTSGGQEANHTALVVALIRAFPAVARDGLRALPGQPVFYVSAEGHNSFDKVAHSTGLGRAAMRRVPVDDALQMDTAELERRIAEDRRAGCLPFLIVGTAGTTSAGVIDPLPVLAETARSEGLWFHVDAAWGGAAVLSEKLRPALRGIERADSITCDAHKWPSVTAGAGMIFVRHRAPVEAAFGVETAYVPEQSRDGRVYPFLTSMQWSRRFIGLKLFLVLAAHGWAGLAARVDHQARMAEQLRTKLRERGFAILNETPLPLVCFTHRRLSDAAAHDAVALRLKLRQVAWISRTLLAGGTPALRACITSYETQTDDIDALVAACAESITS